jgi:hypothetical protein
MREPPRLSGALAELLARDGELDRILDGRGPSYEPAKVIGPPPPAYVPPRSQPQPPDWDAEAAAAQARVREARIQEATALLESLEPPAQPTPPAPKQPSGWQRAPQEVRSISFWLG